MWKIPVPTILLFNFTARGLNFPLSAPSAYSIQRKEGRRNAPEDNRLRRVLVGIQGGRMAETLAELFSFIPRFLH